MATHVRKLTKEQQKALNDAVYLRYDRITRAHDRPSWVNLAQELADYMRPKDRGLWIEVHRRIWVTPSEWGYWVHRVNGRVILKSGWYKSRSSCVWMAKRTAKTLGIRYKEVAK